MEETVIIPRKALKAHRRGVLMMTIEDAAEAVKVSPITWARWERGIQYPHPAALRAICELCKKTPEELGFFASDRT